MGCVCCADLLYGISFIIETDHRNLQWMNRSTTKKVLNRSFLLQNFVFTVRHIPGVTNAVADALSRLPQYAADVKGIPVPSASKAKAKASIVDDEELEIINLGYLSNPICERRRIDSNNDDKLPHLCPLTALEDLNEYDSGRTLQTARRGRDVVAQERFDQGMTELLTSAGFMDARSSESLNDPKALEAQKFVNQTLHAACHGKSRKEMFPLAKSMKISVTYPSLKHSKAQRALVDEEFGEQDHSLAALKTGRSSRMRLAVDCRALGSGHSAIKFPAPKSPAPNPKKSKVFVFASL